MTRFIAFMIVATLAVSCAKNSGNRNPGIESIILRHTGLDIQSMNYTIAEDTIIPEKLSLNYCRETVLKFDSISFAKLETIITNSQYFDRIQIDGSSDWARWDTVAPAAKSGVWCTTQNGYTFLFRNDGKHFWAKGEGLTIIVRTADRSVKTVFFDRTHENPLE